MVLAQDFIIPVTRDRRKLSFGGSFHWNYSTDFCTEREWKPGTRFMAIATRTHLPGESPGP